MASALFKKFQDEQAKKDSEYKVWEKIDTKKYPVVCPNCGAPHNPNEMRCEYCGGYMKEE